MKNTEITISCFSREEFFRDFVPEKGDRQMNYTEVKLRASVARNFLGTLFLKKGTDK